MKGIEQVDFEELIKSLRAKGELPSYAEFWCQYAGSPLPRRFPCPPDLKGIVIHPLLSNEMENMTEMIEEQTIHNFFKKEREIVEKILREYIDNPIKGEITREKIKAAGIRAVVYDEDMNGEPLPEIKATDGCISLTITSALIGVAQGNYMISADGLRRRLTEKEEAYLRKKEGMRNAE